MPQKKPASRRCTFILNVSTIKKLEALSSKYGYNNMTATLINLINAAHEDAFTEKKTETFIDKI